MGPFDLDRALAALCPDSLTKEQAQEMLKLLAPLPAYHTALVRRTAESLEEGAPVDALAALLCCHSRTREALCRIEQLLRH